jgi:hypothetical protein
MSVEVKGRLVNLKYRVYPSATWLTIVCTEDSSFEITSEIDERETNCGIKSNPGTPRFSAQVNAVQNANPTSTEADYKKIKDLILAGTKVQFLYENEADAAVGLSVAEGIYNKGNGYFSNLSSASAADAQGVLTYSLTLTGTGTLDDFDES